MECLLHFSWTILSHFQISDHIAPTMKSRRECIHAKRTKRMRGHTGKGFPTRRSMTDGDSSPAKRSRGTVANQPQAKKRQTWGQKDPAPLSITDGDLPPAKRPRDTVTKPPQAKKQQKPGAKVPNSKHGRWTKWVHSDVHRAMLLKAIMQVLNHQPLRDVARSYGRYLNGKWKLPERTLRKYFNKSEDKSSTFHVPFDPSQLGCIPSRRREIKHQKWRPVDGAYDGGPCGPWRTKDAVAFDLLKQPWTRQTVESHGPHVYVSLVELKSASPEQRRVLMGPSIKTVWYVTFGDWRV